jgi:C-terminal processing protease CtpA/Prc
MGLAMLEEMKKNLEENYYDPKYRGMDLKTRFQQAKERVRTLNYNWQIFRVLAQLLLDLDDSHTSLILPPRTDHFEYGFTTQMIGDDCFVVSVKKGSDAEKKGLRAGDQLLRIGRFIPTRQNLWKIGLLLYKLDPAKTVDLGIKNAAGAESEITVDAKTMTDKEFAEAQKKRKEAKQIKPFKCQEVNAELIACKLYTFSVETDQIDKMMKEVGQHPKFILDLRGNGGGRVNADKLLIGYLFDHDVKIADEVTRKKTESRIAKSKKEKSFKGDLIILVDSLSASASEMAARVVQLEKRGKIVGDVSRGALMTSVSFGLFGHLSARTIYAETHYAMSVTVGDIIMSDGNRVEGVGVIPDVAIGPTSWALQHRTDPVLARAAEMMGAKITPEEAGKFYFLSTKEEDEDDDEPEPSPDK